MHDAVCKGDVGECYVQKVARRETKYSAGSRWESGHGRSGRAAKKWRRRNGEVRGGWDGGGEDVQMFGRGGVVVEMWETS